MCAVAAALVTGCSKSGSDDQSASASAAPAAETSAAASAAPASDSASTETKASPAAQVAMGDVSHGSSIFSANCASCHGANGSGGGIGPKLVGEKSRKNYQATVAWIKNPQPPMPKLYPSPLSEKDVDDVAAYVQSL
jgi:ubiquinol-cytochrome c reductase cytochrome c subunit